MRIDSSECHRATFLATFNLGTVIALMYLCAIASLALTALLRSLVHPWKLNALKHLHRQCDGELEQALPPHTPAVTFSDPSPAKEPQPRHLSSATSFIWGTALLFCLALTLVVMAFGIQNVRYCPRSDPTASISVGFVFLWLLFGFISLYACSGLVSWVILTLKLFGKDFGAEFHWTLLELLLLV